jgi:hypothetical protein
MYLTRLATRIKRSVYDPSYYRGLRTQPFSYSLGYLASITFIAALLFTLWSGTTLGPAGVHFLTTVGPMVEEKIPEDLTLTVTKGEVSINRPEPYAIPVPADWKSSTATSTAHKNLLVIDTRTPASIDSFRAADTYVLVDKHNILAYKNSDGADIQVTTIPATASFVLNKANVAPVIDKIDAFLASWGWVLIVVLTILLSVFVFAGMLIAHLVYLLFAALLIWLIAKVRKYPASYGTAYRAGMHLITLPMALGVLVPSLGFQMPLFSYTLVVLILAFVNFAPQKT